MTRDVGAGVAQPVKPHARHRHIAQLKRPAEGTRWRADRGVERIGGLRFLLMAQYDGKAVIPVDVVANDYFPHLSADKFLRKATLGEITLPVVRIDPSSQKSDKGVHLTDLAK